MLRKPTRFPLKKQSKTERMLNILLDGQWHSTSELVRRVGHTFHVSKFVLVHVDGHIIERRRHPDKLFQHEYRLAPPDKGGRRTR